MSAQTPEGRVKATIKKYLTKIGAYFFMPIGGPYAVHGVPDIIVCWHGIFIGIECKAPGKKATTTANQKRHLAEIKAAGGCDIVADCVEDVMQGLQEFTPPAWRHAA